MALPGFGTEAQTALVESLVLVVGAGGVGCGALPLLAASGIGKIAIVDGDIVTESNLHRQTLYSPGQIGAMKARAAADALSTLNPDCEIFYYARFFEDSAEFCALVESASICIDATDSFRSRGVVSTVCERAGKPEIFASAQGYVAQNAAFGAGFTSANTQGPMRPHFRRARGRFRFSRRPFLPRPLPKCPRRTDFCGF